MSNSTLKLTSDQVQLLQQMFGDLASLDYADNQLSKYQKDWLTQYIKVWDVVITQED